MTTLSSFLQKTTMLGVGIAGLGTPTATSRADIVLLGEFHPLTMRLALAASVDWNKEGDFYRYRGSELYLRLPSPGIVLLSTEKPATKPAASLSGKTLPLRFQQDAANSDFFVWVERPAALLGKSLTGESLDLPISAICIKGKRSAPRSVSRARPGPPPAEPYYRTDIVFQMKDEIAARAYRPIIRFAWSAMADRYLGALPGAAATPVLQEGDIFAVRNLELPLSSLAGMLVSLGGAAL
jgi:hypothetical protein